MGIVPEPMSATAVLSAVCAHQSSAVIVLAQVEYWALLEELRAKHSTVTAEPGTADQRATTASGAATTLQQLWQSRVASGEGRQAAAGDQQGKVRVAVSCMQHDLGMQAEHQPAEQGFQ